MKIGIDIDGVITNFEKYVTEKGKSYFDMDVVNSKGYDIAGMFNLTEDDENKFWSDNIYDYADNCPVRKDFRTFIQCLNELGQDWVIITNRCNNLSYCSWNEKTMQKHVESFIKKELCLQDYDNIPIIYTKNKGYTKADAIIDNHVDIMIEDSPEKIRIISEIIPVFKMAAGYNSEINGKNIIPVNDFQSILFFVINADTGNIQVPTTSVHRDII